MAGDWIKIEHVTPDKPEIHRIASILGISAEAVFGHLVRLWVWADQQSLDGRQIVAKCDTINCICRCAKIANAMQEVGWLVTEGEYVTFPNFDRHNTETAKNRAVKSKQKKKERKKSVAKMSPKKGDKTATREEKRREELKEKINTPLTPIGGSANAPGENEPRKPRLRQQLTVELPPNLNTPEANAAWVRWVCYKAERREPLTNQTALEIYGNFAKAGSEAFCRAVTYTIGKGWSGLSEAPANDRGSGNGRARDNYEELYKLRQALQA
jgi:hypothetical protein